MSRITGIRSIRGISTLRNVPAAGGGSDVTPNAVDWSNLTYDDNTQTPGVATVQFTGINQTISVSANWTALGGGNIALNYRVDNSDPTPLDPFNPGVTQLTSSGETISVSNNQWLTFYYAGSQDNQLVTIENNSDSNTTLDTFTVFFIPNSGGT